MLLQEMLDKKERCEETRDDDDKYSESSGYEGILIAGTQPGSLKQKL